MRALVTGSEGFIGRYMVKLLADEGYEVWASVQEKEYGEDVNAHRLVKCDVTVAGEVDDAVGKSRPDVVYHLAAQSYPTVSWDKPQLTMETNAIGTVNLFESLLKHELDPVVVVACSSAEYGYVSEREVPVKETHRLEPLHPYGVSKLAQDHITRQYSENRGMKGVSARIFNTTGPGKVKDAVSDFAKRVAECEAGKLDKVTHGNLNVRRDITDVRDMVRALHACEKARYGEAYNLCSMKTYWIKDILKTLVDMADAEVKTEEDPKLLRKADEPIIMGDNTKIRGETGWEPRIPLEQTLRDTLEQWRARV